MESVRDKIVEKSLPPKKAGNQKSKRDVGTIIGILAGIALIATAIIRGGHPQAFVNLNGFLIVLGGTMATTLIAYPSGKILRLLPVVFNAFKPEIHRPVDFIDQILVLATQYRMGGIKTLEAQEKLLDNFFLREGVQLVVDGYGVRDINEIMDKEISSLAERHQQSQKILKFMAGQAPIFGMAGTLIGLIQMLMDLDDPHNIGPALSVALITTFYGIMLANLIIRPIEAKLRTRTENEVMLIKAIRVGILGIQRKVNPHKIQITMNALLPRNLRR